MSKVKEQQHIHEYGNDHVMIQFNGNMMTDMTKGSIRRKSFYLNILNLY